MRNSLIKTSMLLATLVLVIATTVIPAMAMDTTLSVMPATGGMGTYIFTFVGVLVMACAIIFFMNRKNKDDDEDEEEEEEETEE